MLEWRGCWRGERKGECWREEGRGKSNGVGVGEMREGEARGELAQVDESDWKLSRENCWSLAACTGKWTLHV